MTEFHLTLSERLLISLHNLCATNSSMARKSAGSHQTVQTGIEEVNQNMEDYIIGGYFALFGNEGNRRLYLTNTGIMRICASFS